MTQALQLAEAGVSESEEALASRSMDCSPGGEKEGRSSVKGGKDINMVGS